MKFYCLLVCILPVACIAQLKWQRVDSLFQPLPADVHVYHTNDALDGKPNIAYYVEAPLKSKRLNFTTDTTMNRRLTPQGFYAKNNNPLLVVNGTFFSFETNRNLNIVIKDGKTVSKNINTEKQKTGDTTKTVAVYKSAIGINKKGKADVAWIKSDTVKNETFATQFPVQTGAGNYFRIAPTGERISGPVQHFLAWKMQTAIGGGPALLQKGKISISNNEERMFAGKAIEDKHPRTAMGYTKDGKLIILVVQGRFPGKAEGATLIQEAKMLQQIGCWEALNLDGGGSSCMLVNGKETITPSDKEGERAVPAVFIIKAK
jgi:exopolysaccharide biosynthesis protein